MTNFILHAVLFVAWIAYNFPPLASSRSKAAQVARCILAAVIGGCVGWGFGNSLMEVLFR